MRKVVSEAYTVQLAMMGTASEKTSLAESILSFAGSDSAPGTGVDGRHGRRGRPTAFSRRLQPRGAKSGRQREVERAGRVSLSRISERVPLESKWCS